MKLPTPLLALFLSLSALSFRAPAADRLPNVVLIFADDLGYADVGPFGSKTPTPHLDSLADGGVKFTQFYVAQAVCSASRTALLTGCYPNRVGIIDGKDISALMTNPASAKTPHDVYYLYWSRHLQAVRSGKWKLHFPHAYVKPDPAGMGGQPGRMTDPRIELSLFDLESDPGERTNVADRHPGIVNRLRQLADAARQDLGDSETKQEGKNVRPAGKF